MSPLLRRLAILGGLLLAGLCALVAGQASRAERFVKAGEAARRQGDLRGAAAAYGEAARLGSADAALDRGRMLLALGEWVAAEGALREAMALSPARGRPHGLLAALETRRPGAWDGAREERVLASCRTAVALEPAPSAAWSGCGDALLALYALRRPAWDGARAAAVLGEAVADYREALVRKPGGAGTVLAGILEAGGGTEILVEAALRSAEPAAIAAAVGALASRRLWSEEQARSLAAASPDDPGAWYLLGETLRRAGRRDAAVEAYREAARRAPAVEAYRRAAGG